MNSRFATAALFLLLLPGMPVSAQARLPGTPLPGSAPASALREPVHPRRNVEEFPAVQARLLRFTILRTSGQEPCLDELEVYGPDAPERNLALASAGTRARASGTYPEYRIHALAHINDGLYGNGHSWISNTAVGSWVELEFPAPVRISRVVWSRDRERKFIDRLATEYRIEVSESAAPDGAGNSSRQVASSADRRPLPQEAMGAGLLFNAPGNFAAAPAPVAPPGNDRPAARDYLLRIWQTADGLPSNTVTSLLQTGDGWLWVGTTNGLARFDGRRFTAFGEDQGLRNLNITCLFEDREGTLWAGTEGGGLAFRRGGRFHTLPTGTSLAGNTVLALAADAEGVLWIATAEALLQYRSGHLERVLNSPVTGLAMGENGLWLLHESVLSRWDGGKLVKAPANLDPSCFSSISALAGGKDGALWFGGANGYIGRLAGGAVTTFGDGHTVLTSNTWQLLAIAGGDLWIGTSSSGLARLRGHDLLPLTTDDGLPSNCVRALCQDRTGNL
ncbi:MAG: Protein of unknown function (DUF1553)/Protein of unknown function (DUF1549)/Planctomycete [Verrucomicrobiales bacterium]|nr:Protein of unknown function (DUF1553)/Protein of unknown function (DUF1549)/Planctomycete [Verrucomicrobiales bacterium]